MRNLLRTLAALILLAAPLRAGAVTIYFAGGEDVDFVQYGSVYWQTGGGILRPAFERMGIGPFNTSVTTDPPADYVLYGDGA